MGAVAHLASSGLDVFAHNIETCERLTRRVRDARAGYRQSLEELRAAKRAAGVYTTTSIMLGLGETDDEVGAGGGGVVSGDVNGGVGGGGVGVGRGGGGGGGWRRASVCVCVCVCV